MGGTNKAATSTSCHHLDVFLGHGKLAGKELMLCSVLLSPTTHTSLHAAPSPLSHGPLHAARASSTSAPSATTHHQEATSAAADMAAAHSSAPATTAHH